MGKDKAIEMQKGGNQISCLLISPKGQSDTAHLACCTRTLLDLG